MADRAPYDLLADELNRTSVISDDFKGTILGWAGKIAEDAYKRGEQAAQAVHEEAKRPQPPEAPYPEGATHVFWFDGASWTEWFFCRDPRLQHDGSLWGTGWLGENSFRRGGSRVAVVDGDLHSAGKSQVLLADAGTWTDLRPLDA